MSYLRQRDRETGGLDRAYYRHCNWIYSAKISWNAVAGLLPFWRTEDRDSLVIDYSFNNSGHIQLKAS